MNYFTKIINEFISLKILFMIFILKFENVYPIRFAMTISNLDSYNLMLKLKLATIVEGDPKAPFSIATTPRCRGGRYSIPRIAPLYPWTVPYNAEC